MMNNQNPVRDDLDRRSPATPRTDHSGALLRRAAVVGGPSELRTQLCAALTESGARILVSDCFASQPQQQIRCGSGRSDDGPTPDTYMIVGTPPPPARAADLMRWRARSVDKWLTKAVVDTAAAAHECRVMVLCDARLTGRSPQATSWSQQLARRIAYETEINGTPVTDLCYLTVGGGISADDAVRVIVNWHWRRLPRRSRR